MAGVEQLSSRILPTLMDDSYIVLLYRLEGGYWLVLKGHHQQFPKKKASGDLWSTKYYTS